MLSETRRNRVAAVTGSRPAAPGGQCQCRRGPPEPGFLPGSCGRRAPHQLRRRRRRGASKAAGPSCAPGGSRGRREPRYRRLEPTSAETKMPEESANTHPGSRGHKLGCETETPALKNNKKILLITQENGASCCPLPSQNTSHSSIHVEVNRDCSILKSSEKVSLVNFPHYSLPLLK